jgi:hypothetical protein
MEVCPWKYCPRKYRRKRNKNILESVFKQRLDRAVSSNLKLLARAEWLKHIWANDVYETGPTTALHLTFNLFVVVPLNFVAELIGWWQLPQLPNVEGPCLETPVFCQLYDTSKPKIARQCSSQREGCWALRIIVPGECLFSAIFTLSNQSILISGRIGRRTIQRWCAILVVLVPSQSQATVLVHTRPW